MHEIHSSSGRNIRLSGEFNFESGIIPKVLWQNNRIQAEYDKDGRWKSIISKFERAKGNFIQISNTSSILNIDVAGLLRQISTSTLIIISILTDKVNLKVLILELTTFI